MTHTSHSQILTPLFFASIGFSIPFLALWTGARIWRGIVYAVLMALGKILAGVPLLLVDVFAPMSVRSSGNGDGGENRTAESKGGNTKAERRRRSTESVDAAEVRTSRLHFLRDESLPAAAFLGLALVARGEIGVRFPSFVFLCSFPKLTLVPPFPADPRPSSRPFRRLHRRRPLLQRPRGGTLPRRDLGGRVVYDCWTCRVRCAG